MQNDSLKYDPAQLSGRNRRLWYEWQQLECGLADSQEISFQVIICVVYVAWSMKNI